MTISSLSEPCVACGVPAGLGCPVPRQLPHNSTKPRSMMRTLARAAMQRPGNRWFRWGRWVISSFGAPTWA